MDLEVKELELDGDTSEAESGYINQIFCRMKSAGCVEVLEFFYVCVADGAFDGIYGCIMV